MGRAIARLRPRGPLGQAASGGGRLSNARPSAGEDRRRRSAEVRRTVAGPRSAHAGHARACRARSPRRRGATGRSARRKQRARPARQRPAGRSRAGAARIPRSARPGHRRRRCARRTGASCRRTRRARRAARIPGGASASGGAHPGAAPLPPRSPARAPRAQRAPPAAGRRDFHPEQEESVVARTRACERRHVQGMVDARRQAPAGELGHEQHEGERRDASPLEHAATHHGSIRPTAGRPAVAAATAGLLQSPPWGTTPLHACASHPSGDCSTTGKRWSSCWRRARPLQRRPGANGARRGNRRQAPA